MHNLSRNLPYTHAVDNTWLRVVNKKNSIRSENATDGVLKQLPAVAIFLASLIIRFCWSLSWSKNTQ